MQLSTLTRRFVGGRCPTTQLPETISLRGIRQVMKRLWRQSVRDRAAGVVVEHAATLVRRAEGKVRLDYFVAGTAGTVTPVYEVAPEETFIGTYHTHPYENGLTGMAFSRADFISAIRQAEWISLVQSGDDVFALIRTDKTAATVEPLVFEAEFHLLYRAARQAGLEVQEALVSTNVGMCGLYGLAFYVGLIGGNLEVIFKP